MANVDTRSTYKSRLEPSKTNGTAKTLVLGIFTGAGIVLTLQHVTSTSPASSTIPSLLRRRLYPRDASQASLPIPQGSFPGDIGSTLAHRYPPTSPTNALSSLFPTRVGFAGGTATGAEAFIVATAMAYPTGGGGAVGLVDPGVAGNEAGQTPAWIDTSGEDVVSGRKFTIFEMWSTISPWYPAPKGAFGVQATPEVPAGCQLKGVHILHRHGARYPTGSSGYASPAALAARFHNASSTLHGEGPLSFLNAWTYKLGTATLNHFGRQQMFDLGVSMRMKYGHLLEGFTDTLPVIRTTSQDRMLASSTNFAFGFFGWPLEGKMLQEVMIEGDGFNNTLAPGKSCPNADIPARSDRGSELIKEWIGVYLSDARTRLQAVLTGYVLTLEDVFAMQTMCAYETSALGYSAFCPLFTEDEWEGFEYAQDIKYWYNSAFGSPVARALGSGYVLELLSRLTHTPLSTSTSPHLFAINTTHLSAPFSPLTNPLYIDATHDTTMLAIYTALNLTALSVDGPPGLNTMRRAAKRRWVTSRFVGFGSSVQVQVLDCSSSGDGDDSAEHVRIIINDAPVSLSGISGCPSGSGICPVATFVQAQKQLVQGADWEWTCFGNWTVGEGTGTGTVTVTVTGDPPAKP